MSPILLFFGVIAAVLGVYWLVIARHEAETHRALQKRLRPQEETARKTGLSLAKSEQKAAGAAALKGLQSIIDQSGGKTTAAKLLGTCAISGVTGAIVGYVVSGVWLAAPVVGLAGAWLPFMLTKRAADKRMRRFEEQFPEAIDLIARALRAGHAFPTGLSMVAEELGDPVGSEFKLLYDRQNFGMPMPDALRSLAARVPIIDARFFVTAVLTQREAGGNLSGVLDNLSGVIRERFKVKREVGVKSAQGRLTGMILMGMPVGLGIYQLIVTPDIFRKLLDDPWGPKMLAGAAVMQLIGWLWIQKIVKIEY